MKRASVKTVGNFWVDLTRGLLYFVIPLSALWAIPLAWQGVPQTWKPYQTANLMEPYTTQVQKTDDKGNNVTTNIQLVCRTPKLDASGQTGAGQRRGGDGGCAAGGCQRPADHDQCAGHGGRARWTPSPSRSAPWRRSKSIKQLFTNGGGWYNVNSAHPFENPTPLTNFLEMLAIIVVPMAQVYMFGLLVGNKKHAWCLFNVMLALYVLSFVGAWYFETRPNPVTGGHAAEHGRQGAAHRRDEQRALGHLLHGD